MEVSSHESRQVELFYDRRQLNRESRSARCRGRDVISACTNNGWTIKQIGKGKQCSVGPMGPYSGLSNLPAAGVLGSIKHRLDNKIRKNIIVSADSDRTI